MVGQLGNGARFLIAELRNMFPAKFFVNNRDEGVATTTYFMASIIGGGPTSSFKQLLHRFRLLTTYHTSGV